VRAIAQNTSSHGGQFGYYTDTETGLLCLTHRYYDPGTGKFLNRDPIGYAGGENLYGFADGNPVNESDPSGFAGGEDDAEGDDIFGQRELQEIVEQERELEREKELRDAEARRHSGIGSVLALEEELATPAQRAASGRRLEEQLDEEAANFKKLTGGPSEAFSRKDHYGRTPTRPQKNSVPKGMLFDHDPPLGQHYYEGDGQGGKPGYQMTQEERLIYARRLDVGKPAVPEQRHGQGGTVKAYTERMRKMYDLPPYSKP